MIAMHIKVRKETTKEGLTPSNPVLFSNLKKKSLRILVMTISRKEKRKKKKKFPRKVVRRGSAKQHFWRKQDRQ